MAAANVTSVDLSSNYNVNPGSSTNYQQGNLGASESNAYQLGAAQSSVVVTAAASHEFVAPFIADLCADASGTVGVLEQQQVTITGIDSIFDMAADATRAKDFMRGFTIVDENEVPVYSRVDWLNTTPATQAAQVRVDMASGARKDAFLAALDQMIANSGLVAGHAQANPDGNSLYNYLKVEARKDTDDMLAYDTLANILGGSAVLSFDIAIDSSRGAVSMWENMNDASKAAARRALLTQLPHDNIDAYLTPSTGSAANRDQVKTVNFLPLMKGDKISLVFDATVGEYAWNGSPSGMTGAAINTANQDGALLGTGANQTLSEPTGAVTGSGVTNSYKIGKLTFTAPTRRRVALRIQMTAEPNAAFPSTLEANGFVLNLD